MASSSGGDADVGVSGRAEQREYVTAESGGAESGFELFLRQRARLEELLHQRVVGLRHELDQRLARRLRAIAHSVGNVAGGRPPGSVAREGDARHPQQIDGASEVLLLPDRDLNRDDGTTKGAAKRFEGPIEAGALPVEQVQHDQTRQTEVGGEVPDLLRLNLDPGHGIDDDECGVRHAQGGAHVAQEVAHAGRVDEVELPPLPLRVGDARRQRVLARHFLFVEVGDRGAVIHHPEPIDHAGAEQQGGRQLCLAGPAMADDGDVADARGTVDLHWTLPLLDVRRRRSERGMPPCARRVRARRDDGTSATREGSSPRGHS